MEKEEKVIIQCVSLSITKMLGRVDCIHRGGLKESLKCGFLGGETPGECQT